MSLRERVSRSPAGSRDSTDARTLSRSRGGKREVATYRPGTLEVPAPLAVGRDLRSGAETEKMDR